MPNCKAADSPWTEDRVAELKRLYADGLSFSQIAKELNCGFSSNAVIGKLHRLKLVGRVRPARQKVPRGVPSKPDPVRSMLRGMTTRHNARFTAGGHERKLATVTLPELAPISQRNNAVANRLAREEDTGIACDGITDLPAEAPPEGGITLMQLQNETCRWPFGDPREPSFRYCGCAGANNAAGRPYCDDHADMARGVHGVDYRSIWPVRSGDL